MTANNLEAVKKIIRGVNNKWIIFDYHAKNPDYHSDNYNFLKSDVLLGYFYKMGIYKTEEIEEYFTSNDYVENFNRVHFVDKAVQIFVSAVNQKKEVVVFSDYDVDGINSALYISKFLDSLGYSNGFHYHVLINERKYDYGVNKFVLSEMLKYKDALILIMDSGTTYCKAMIDLLNHGHDVIVIDHHEPSQECFIRGIADEYPNFAIINPKVGSEVEYYHYASTGVLVYYFVQNVIKYLQNKPKNKLHTDLPALSIISDYMKWTKSNMTLIKDLYEMIHSKNTNPIYVRALQGKNVSFDSFHKDLSFVLVPMINSMGRMNKAGDAFYMMYEILTDTKADVEKVYQYFDMVNSQRKSIQNQEKNKIESFIKSKYGNNLPNFLLINIYGMDRGILSSLAANIAGQYGKPVMLLTLKNNKWDGSARAPRYLDNFLNTVRELREPYLMANGHQSAFGVSISRLEESYLMQIESKINKNIESYKQILDPKIDEIIGEIKDANDVREIMDNIHLFVPSNFLNRATYMVSNYTLDGKYLKIDGEKYLCVFENSYVYMNQDHHPALVVRPTILKDEPGFIITDTIF